MPGPTDFIPYAKPSIGKEEENAVIRVLQSGWLTTGRVTLEFEQAFARYVNSGFAIAVSSGTAGLHLALESTGIDPDSFVITTPYTFAATAEIIRYLNAHPLFVDICEPTFNIDPSLIEKALAEEKRPIRALIPVHIGGLACDMAHITALAGQYALPIVEDCAHAFPVNIDGRYVGTMGTHGVFSFYANKTITTGEGGMIITDNAQLASRIRVMRTHGIDREAWDRYTSERNSWYYEIVEAGYKYNLTDIASAIGLVQLEKAEQLNDKRRRIAAMYFRGLETFDFIRLPESHPSHSWHLYIVRIVPEKLTITRDEFIGELTKRGIGISVHYTPLHLMPYYKKKYGFQPDDFPIAFKNSKICFSLPIYPDLGPEQVDRIIAAVKEIGFLHRPRHLTAPVEEGA